MQAKPNKLQAANADDNLTKLLNASGFAFQLAVESAVKGATMREPWSVTAREYPWRTDGGKGYIDIVLSRGNLHLAVECKRHRDANWMFLMPDEKQLARSHARIRWTDTMPNRRSLAGWGDVQIYPKSPEADFCAVRGQGETDSPLLERLAASVSEAAEGLSADLISLSQRVRRVNVVVPVIVTTANLLVSRFDPAKVDLARGEVANATFIDAPHVRFRKSLAAATQPDEYEPEALRDLGSPSERTVFVVQAIHFVDWLRDFEVGDSSRPWESARGAADAMGD